MSHSNQHSETPGPQQPLLLWAVFFFVIGGFVGWSIGRDTSPAQSNEPANGDNSPVAAAPTVNAEPVTAANSSPAQVIPTPVSITPETIKTLGDPEAPVTVVEFSDYQCPFCLRHFNNTMPLLQPYIDAGQVRYVFPIHSFHPQAQKAHEAARCARELGGDDAYWTMHDPLFSNQETWAQVSVPNHVSVFKSLAGEAGLPPAEFDACLDSGKIL